MQCSKIIALQLMVMAMEMRKKSKKIKTKRMDMAMIVGKLMKMTPSLRISNQ
jgi:hypothetical protein